MTAEEAQIWDEVAADSGLPTIDDRLEKLREHWERQPGNLATLLEGLHLSAHRSQPLPSWVAYGLQDVLIKQMAAQNVWLKDEKRWMLVQHLHFDLGLTFDEAGEGAAKELGGSSNTMKKSYKEYEKYLRENSPEQCASAAVRNAGRPHPGFVEVDIGYCHARRIDLPWLLKRCPGLVEFGAIMASSGWPSTTPATNSRRPAKRFSW